MTVEKLKKHPYYQFECNITDESFKEIEELFDGDFDEWGIGFCRFGDDIGVEYNLCLKRGENYSAIYCMYGSDGYMATDYSDFIHYEIDPTDKNWKEKFEDAMCEALIIFFYL